MKKTIILFILIPFLYLNIGFYPFFLLKQQLIKKEIKLKLKGSLSNNELTVLVLDKANYNSIKWIKINEFSFNNHMYDVVKIENTINNCIKIVCIDDNKENSLLLHLDKLTKTSEKSKQNKEYFLSKLLVKDYMPTNNLIIRRSYKIINRFYIIRDFYNSFVSEKLSPPPKFC